MTYQSYYRVSSWCWVRTREDGTQVRASWVFQTLDKANRWRNNKCWKYVEYGTVEDYLKTVVDSRKVVEAKRWVEHRDLYNSLELYRAYVQVPRLNGEEDE